MNSYAVAVRYFSFLIAEDIKNITFVPIFEGVDMKCAIFIEVAQVHIISCRGVLECFIESLPGVSGLNSYM